MDETLQKATRPKETRDSFLNRFGEKSDGPRSQERPAGLRTPSSRSRLPSYDRGNGPGGRQWPFSSGGFLHENRTEGCTAKAMDKAAANGHLAVVMFLDENRSEGCTARAMADAAEADHVDVVEYLYFNRTEGCLRRATNKCRLPNP